MPIAKRVSINAIRPSPFQPRQYFDEDKLEELAKSISEVDLIEPIVLRKKNQSESYELIAGERRWRACQKAGLKEIDAVIYENINDFEALLLSGTENLHREDLTSIERENLIYHLWELGREAGEIREGHGSYTDLARKLGLTTPAIQQTIKAKEFRDASSFSDKVSTFSIAQTKSLPPEERTKILERVEKEEIAPSKVQTFVRTMKQVSKPVKEAMLKSQSKITPEVAHEIEQKIPTKTGRKEAIVQIEGSAFPATEPAVGTIIEEIGAKEHRKQLVLTEFIDEDQKEERPEIREKEVTIEKEIPGSLSIQFYPYTYLDGSKAWRGRRVGDGSIIEIFDATPAPKSQIDVICPHFMQLKWATGCPFDCAWCYLQGTLPLLDGETKPNYKDRKKIARHIECFVQSTARPEILNTGELSDSLMGEREKGKKPFSKFIIDLVKKHRRINRTKHKILFLTRSDYIEHLLEANGQDVAICSITVNALEVARRWEAKVPSVQNRLEAARKLKDAGYEVRLRIDPMVPIENWEEEYLDLIDLIFKYLIPDRITLGSPRGLQSTLDNAKNKAWAKYLSERTDRGLGVPFDARYAVYKAVIDKLRKKYIYMSVSLCKETLAMWTKLGMDFSYPMCNCIA